MRNRNNRLERFRVSDTRECSCELRVVLILVGLCRIQVHISRLNSVKAYNVFHKTEGMIPNHADLHIEYAGELPIDRWLSFVDDTLNGNFPCGAGYHAAGL